MVADQDDVRQARRLLERLEQARGALLLAQPLGAEHDHHPPRHDGRAARDLGQPGLEVAQQDLLAGGLDQGEVERLAGVAVGALGVHERPGRVVGGPPLAGAGGPEQQQLLGRRVGPDRRAQDPLRQRLPGDLDHRKDPTADITRACTVSTGPSPVTSRTRSGKRRASSW